MELVTPEGNVVTLGGKLKKDSTGYCLTQLIVGSGRYLRHCDQGLA